MEDVEEGEDEEEEEAEEDEITLSPHQFMKALEIYILHPSRFISSFIRRFNFAS